jgi:hypothetical protein
MLDSWKDWIRKQGLSGSEPEYVVEPLHSLEDQMNEHGDVYLPSEEVFKIHNRIRHCLDEDYDVGEEVDETLRLMREETENWGKGQPSESLNFSVQSPNNVTTWSKGTFPKTVTGDDELLGYCLMLERNNAYLLQLVERYEQVSFKKRYSELMMSNESLQKEYNRLKSTNGKVYASYCDLLEEIKRMKEADKKLRQELNASKETKNSQDAQIRQLKKDLQRMQVENETSSSKVRELRKSNSSLQKSLSEKEDEMIKMKGTNIATSLKLERAEMLLLRERDIKAAVAVAEEASPVKQENEVPSEVLETEEEEEGEEVSEPESASLPDDTIAQLQLRYQNKAKLAA